MKFLAISDTHCRHHNIRLPKADVLLHAGDISYRGKKEESIDFLEWFAKQDFQYKIFIAGNHDFYFEKAKVILQIVPVNTCCKVKAGIVTGIILKVRHPDGAIVNFVLSFPPVIIVVICRT